MDLFVEDLVIILSVSLAVCLLFSRLQLPTILAYMVSGALIGPQLLGLVKEPERFSLLAEFGVVFLLFSLGLEFSLSRMLRIKKFVFATGSCQVIACTGVFYLAVHLWGASANASVMIAGALALSSTAIVTRELTHYQQLNRRYSQISIGILLFQDLIALFFLILIPVLAKSSGLGGDLLSALLRGLLLFVILMAAGRWFLPPVYREISKTGSREIFVMGTLVIVLLAAWLTHSLHLSMTLGGFVIGMMLGESDFRHQIESDLRPFKDILLGLFFVTLGMSIDVLLLVNYWPRLLLFTLVLIAMKVAVVSLVVNFLGETKRNALRTGITLAQAGEFGLALLALAHQEGIVPAEQKSFIIILALLSMAASSFLIRKNEWVTDKLLPLLPWTRKEREMSDIEESIILHQSNHVIIGGFGRVGQTIALLLDEMEIPYIAIENDAFRVKRHRREGTNIIYGDCNDLEILEGCHINSARLAVLTFRSHNLAKRTLTKIKDAGWDDIPVILRCHEEGQLEELVSLGADHVVPEMLETRLLIASHVLNLLGLPPEVVDEQIIRLRRRATQLSAPETTESV